MIENEVGVGPLRVVPKAVRDRALAPPIRGHLLDRLYRTLGIDEDWCVWHEDGFEWWPYRLPQRIRITEDRDVDGITAVRAVIETVVAEGARDDDDVHQAIDALNRDASLAAVARHDDGRVTLAASMVLHPDNLDFAWIPLLQTAGLQPSEASRAAHALQRLGAKPAERPHPVMGEREGPDEMNYGALTVVWQRSQWSLELEGALERLAETLRERNVWAADTDSELVAELPFGSGSALLEINSDIEHPRYGRGVLYLLYLPVDETVRNRVEYGPVEVATQLNRRASSLALRANGTHCLGGCVVDVRTRCVVQATFLPAGSCSARVVEQVGFAIAAQGMELGRDLGDTLVGEGPFRTALERIGASLLSSTGSETDDA